MSYVMASRDCPLCLSSGIFPIDEKGTPVPTRFAIAFECQDCFEIIPFMKFYELRAKNMLKIKSQIS